MELIAQFKKVRVTFNRSRSNLRGHQRWMEYCLSDQFIADTKKSFESGRNRSVVRKQVRQIIDEQVYQVYTPDKDQRTYRLLKSFMVAPGSLKSTGLTVYSDPKVAAATAMRRAKGNVSYAAFFLNPRDYNSFIKPYIWDPIKHRIVQGIQLYPQNYRPFYQFLVQYIIGYAPVVANDTYMRRILARRPKMQSIT